MENFDKQQVGQQLATALARLTTKTNDTQAGQLLLLLESLLKWNKTYNLTAITDPQQAIQLHLIDSLSVLPWIKGPSLLDVGTGPGFPGLPLAIMLPDIRFTLLDSNAKKIRFIQQTAHQLGLTNVSATHQRIQQHSEHYSQIISRAFASLPDFISWTRHCLQPGGEWLAMKGRPGEEELSQLAADIHIVTTEPLTISGLDSQRCLVRCAIEETKH